MFQHGGHLTKDLYGAAGSVLNVGMYINLNAYLVSLSGSLYAKFNETSGNLLNYGSDGNSATVAGVTQGEPGIAGVGSYLYDGATSIATFANADIPGTKALTTQRWAFLVKAASAGEVSQGAFMCYERGFTVGKTSMQFSGGNQLRMNLDAVTTDANAVSTAGDLASILGAWAWVFADYDDAGTRKIRLWKAVSGTLTQLTLSTDTAAVGAITTPADDLILGNNSLTSRTFDGNMAVAFAGAGLWTTDELNQLVSLAGV